MDTRVVKISRHRPQKGKLEEAAEIIRRGGLVAFPTETVYGLGANALDKKAIAGIFRAKGRPADDPLIVHIADPGDLHKLAKDLSERTRILAEKFWPGPLTMIVRKTGLVPGQATAGLGTVAVRMPKNRIALGLIRAAGVPIAAPSANLFGRPSPTAARHVLGDLDGFIDMILDGGSTEVGVESTVLDLTGKHPEILRPGGISVEDIRKVLYDTVRAGSGGKIAKAVMKKSPGMGYRHYAPKAMLILVEGEEAGVAGKISELASKYAVEGKSVGIMASKETRRRYGKAGDVSVLGSRKNFSTIARNLFKIIRDFDEKGVEIILAEGFPEEGLGVAVMNRLRRAARRIIRV